ncbi:MAG: family 10 glycosylhydrolase [Saprospiraceae bacterium]|nr:family 10 glycosylhydrolase [Saprospiraceae bacterium]
MSNHIYIELMMMYQYRFLKLLVCFLLFFTSIHAQYAPKREMRGVWIATVLNIDFPSVTTTNSFVLKEDWIRLIDKHKALGINALYVQIRPMADALYKSDLVPWSRFLTGQAGVGPDNGFDLLSFMIQTAHERGMEFHAWLNPYRASMDNPSVATFPDNHILRAHPDWCLFYNKRYIMNPGLPQVRNHIMDVVSEIIRKYDVDAIHFDDYFYPYKNGNEQLNDYATYEMYRGPFTNIEDWRRNNIDLLIYHLSKRIKEINPRVQFGISPFGVWRNGYKDPTGSDTRAGLTCYDDLYADVRKWLKEGWIDYVVPQVYWTFGFQIAEHERIVRWWSDNSNGKPVYVGHAAYRVGQPNNKEQNWGDPNEIPRQIQLSRSLKNVKGSVYFSSKSLINNALGVSDSLRLNYYRYPALTPEVIKDTTSLACEPPEIRAITSEANGRVMLRWKPSLMTTRRHPFQYIVYRFPWGQVDFTNGRNIIAIIPHDAKMPNELTFYDAHGNTTNLYAITVSDCNSHETPAADVVTLNTKPLPIPKIETGRKKVKWWKSFWRRAFGK